MSTISEISKTVSCVLLTLNEEAAIAKVVADIKAVLPEAEIIVVDSSTDKTAELAEKLGCTVVRQIPPRGYGWAMVTGLKKAAGEIIITLDCDDTYPSEALSELVRRMDAGADLVSCSRMERRPAAMKLSHYIANWIFALSARVLCGAKTTDVHTGMRAYRKKMLEQFCFDPDGMALPVELQIGPQRLGFKCQEFFIDYRPRIGDSKLVPLAGTIWTFRRLWRWRRFFNARRMQSTLAILMTLGGLLVRVQIDAEKGPGVVKLDTLKADNLTVPASPFEIPPGFKEVFSPQEIMLGTGADTLKDFIDCS